MAESIESLYLRLGLNLSELTSGFVSAERSVNENMARLNREMQVIRLRTEADLSGLDEATDAVARFQIQQRSLNELMTAQRQRISVANAAYRDMAQRLGENSAQTQRALVALERERAVLARLERQLRQLNETQDETNEGEEDLISRLQNIAGRAAPMVTKAIEAAAAAMAAAGVATHELIENFKELQQQSYELNMSVGKTENFLRHMRLSGGDISDFEGYIRGISDAWVKGEVDDPEFIALSKYGAKITDVTGRLKDFQSITEEVYQAWKKAKAAGEEIEFLQLTGGESGIRDAIQYFERYEEAKEDAAKISTAKLNYDELHQLDREYNLLTEQTNEFKNALGNAVTPMARAATKELFEIFHDGTEFIKENKDEIQKWEFRAIEATKSVKSALSELMEMSKPLSESKGFWQFSDAQNAELNKVHKTIDELNNTNNTLWGRSTETFFNDLFGGVDGIFTRAEQAQREYNQSFQAGMQENQASWADFRREVEKPINLDDNPLSQYAAQRIKEFKYELEDLKAELENWGNDFGQAHAENDLWLKRELTDKQHVSKEERNAILELYAAKEARIKQERADKIEDIREQELAQYRTTLENRIAEAEKARDEWIQIGMDEAEATELYQKRIAAAYEETAQRTQQYLKEAADIEFSLTHDAFEKQLRDINQWKDAQLEKADTAEEVAAIIKDAAMKEAEAFEREVDRIQGKIESAQDRLMRLSSSQRDYDLYRAQKQYQQDISDGVPVAMAQQIYDLTVRDINKKTAEDKSGNYSMSPNGGAERYIYEFNQSVGDTTKSLAQMDARALAYQGAMSRLTNGSVQLTTAAMQNIRTIEAENAARQAGMGQQQIISKNPKPPWELIYGDQVVKFEEELTNNAQNMSNAVENVGANIENTKTSLDGIITANEEISTAFNQTAEASDEVKERFSQIAQVEIEPVNSQLLSFKDGLQSAEDESKNFADILNNSVATINEFREKILGMEFTPQNSVSQGKPEEFDKLGAAFDATSVAGTLMTLASFIPALAPAATALRMAGLMTNSLGEIGGKANDWFGQPSSDSVQNVAANPVSSEWTNRIQQLIESQSTSISEMSTTVKEINQHLPPTATEIAQAASNMAKSLENIEKQGTSQNITVSPNINVDLGGAYVFDNNMKDQLTEDITNRVAEAVKSAVQQATNNRSYGYAS